MTVSRPLSNFKGNNLLIGCGHNHMHYFTLTDENPLPAEQLHPKSDFYIVNINDELNEEKLAADAIMDFSNKDVLDFFGAKRFNFICFERIATIFCDAEATQKCLKNAQKLLTNDGVCLIFAGGRGLTASVKQTILSSFKYSTLITYGAGETWTFVLSNDAKQIDSYRTLSTTNNYFKSLYYRMSLSTYFKVEHHNPFSFSSIFFGNPYQNLSRQATPGLNCGFKL